MTKQATAPNQLSADQAVGLTVAQYLQAAMITKTKVSDVLGCSRVNASKKVAGKVGWSIEEIYSLAEFFGLDTTDLLPQKDDTGSWLPAPFNPAFLSRGIGKTPSPLDRNEDGVWRARQDSNLQPSDPKYLNVLAVHSGFVIEQSTKVHIFLPLLPATLALPATPVLPSLPATPAKPVTPVTLVLLFILVMAGASTFGCTRGYRKGFIK